MINPIYPMYFSKEKQREELEFKKVQKKEKESFKEILDKLMTKS